MHPNNVLRWLRETVNLSFKPGLPKVGFDGTHQIFLFKLDIQNNHNNVIALL